MRSLLAKISPHRAAGVYIGENEIAISQVVGTPLGPVETFRHCESYRGEEQLAGVLKRLLAPLVGKRRKRGRPVAFGLPQLKVFCSTRPLKATNVDVSPKVLLHEVLRSPNSNVDEMTVDLVETSPGSRPLVSLASCRKKYLAGLLEYMQECQVRPFRVEPATCAMLRAAEQQHRAPRKAKTVLRLFMGDGEGLAILSTGSWPIVSRPFAINLSDVSKTILSTVRTIESVGKLCGTESAIDAVLVHGGAQLREGADLEELERQLGARLQWHAGPALDSGSVALGLALGCLKPNLQAFDLARSMKPRASIWEIFPYGEVALHAVILICLGMFLMNRSEELASKYAAVRAETVGRHWLASMTDQQLTKEKQDLEQRVESVRKFLATRIVWSGYTHDIPSRLPVNTKLNSFQGMCEIEKKGKRDEAFKPKKSFVLRIGAPVAQDGTAPKEIDSVLDSLREHELLSRDFPLVELADIKWFQPFVGAKPTAFFTVVCMPKPTTFAAPALSDKPKPKDH